ncbi:MAG: hypothetical protein GQ470_03405 [Gammaproteobacteria bacterium]|nr:hypothetical protein [Gammaproteobacteria bacterium]
MMRTRLFCFLILFTVVAPLSANPLSVESYRRLADSGAPQLALDGLRERAPNIDSNPAEWANWQRAELHILAKQQWWQQLLDQIEGYPETAPFEFIDEIQKIRIEGLLELDRFQEARQLLVKQIWGVVEPEPEPESEPEPEPDHAQGNSKLKLWRELIVKSYISEGRSDDAYISMQHFRHDYGIEDENTTLLLIQTLLASNFPKIAEGVIDKLPISEEKRLLKQLVRLRQGIGVRSIQFASREKLQQKGLTPFQYSMLWGMVAEAAEFRTDDALRVTALEAFLRERRSKKIDLLFNLDAQQLWNAYDGYAQRVANRQQLLLGDDSAWMESAHKAGMMYPVHRRSIYAYLARHALLKQRRIAAEEQFVALLKKLNKGDGLITSLYASKSGGGKRDDSELGQQVLSVLLDNALRDRDLERASELISHIDSPEEGKGLFVWSLRKAKIFLLANSYVQSVEVIERLINDLPNTTEKNRDRLIQLIFDLQTAHRDVAAVRLLTSIDSQIIDPKLHRELLYWIADSNMALEQYRLAAQGYLESAMVPGIHTMDPWAQTARYQAAKALLKAELKGDARAIYAQLLKHTKNPSRRAILKQELEQIHLH